MFSHYSRSDSIHVKTLTVRPGEWDCGRLFYLCSVFFLGSLSFSLPPSLFPGDAVVLGMLCLGAAVEPRQQAPS